MLASMGAGLHSLERHPCGLSNSRSKETPERFTWPGGKSDSQPHDNWGKSDSQPHDNSLSLQHLNIRHEKEIVMATKTKRPDEGIMTLSINLQMWCV